MTPSDTAATTRSIARAEPIGSLLRSPEILEKLKDVFADSHTGARSLVIESAAEKIADFNRLADAAIVDLVRHQIDAGLDVVTDGEIRRSGFINSFMDSLSGLGEPEGIEYLYNQEGDVVGETFGHPVFLDRVRKTYSPAAEEATFLRAITQHPFKITLPAPSGMLIDFVSVEGSPYASQVEFVEDAVAILKQIAAEAIAAGTRWIQFDFPVYPALTAESYGPLGSMLENVYAQGETNESLLEKALAFDAAVTADLPDDVTVAMHLCRGNLEGGFWSGSLAPIAERIFNELPHDRFLFEWEDIEREGGYEQIRHVPKERIMAMGVVSTKTAAVEDDDEVVRRIEAAAEYLDLGQLAITPQCGFASMSHDNMVADEEAQWRKLELIGRVAERVWGR